MKAIIYIFGVLSIGILMNSCADEEIPWDIKEIPQMLVVEGRFTNEACQHTIRLSRTDNYFSNQRTPVISGANVTVTEVETGTIYPLTEEEEGSGLYLTAPDVSGKAGNAYRLDILLPEPLNGSSSYFAEGKIIQGIDIDSLNAIIYENPFYVEGSPMDSLILIVAIFGPEPQEIENYYELLLYKNHRLVNDTIDESILFHDEEGFDGAYVNSLYLFEEFVQRDTLMLEILSVDQSYGSFVNGISNIADQSADPFDISGPPANAIGNIQGAEAVGFFKVAYISRGETVAKLEE